jgi:hypothetical protein
VVTSKWCPEAAAEAVPSSRGDARAAERAGAHRRGEQGRSTRSADLDPCECRAFAFAFRGIGSSTSINHSFTCFFLGPSGERHNMQLFRV